MVSRRNYTLDALDEALMSVRRLLHRPGYQRRFFAELGEPMDFGMLRTVRAVGRSGDSQPGVSQIAERLGVDVSTASRLIERAVVAGYVSRVLSPNDRRCTLLSLTEIGTDLLERANAARRKLLGEVTADWDPGELDELTSLLDRLRAELDEFER